MTVTTYTKEDVTKEDVERRIEDWIRRLNSLYSMIERWLPNSNYRIKKSEILQVTEELMNKFHVKPRKVPTLTIYKNNKNVVFIPSVLWILGADGKVNISTDDMQYILVDRRENDHSESDWQLVGSDIKRITIPFDAGALSEVLSKNT